MDRLANKQTWQTEQKRRKIEKGKWSSTQGDEY
jgi:hypothetical protein